MGVSEKAWLAACKKGDLTLLRKWKRRGVTFSGQPLCIAVAHGSPDVVRCMVQELGADVNSRNEDGFTPFFTGVQEGRLAGLQCLVNELGADINQASSSAPKSGLLPLPTAAFLGHLDVVRYLVKELRVDINQADEKGCTALMAASMGKHNHVIRWLVKEGADVQVASIFNGKRITAVGLSTYVDAAPEQKAYLEAKEHCSSPDCGGAGQLKCQGCFQARYCGQPCQLAHWKAHKADCKRWSAELAAGAGTKSTKK